MVNKSEGAKAPLNPFYEGVPFIFKRTGEVKRCKNAPRFGRKISMTASKVARDCEGVKSLTVSDENTTYILSYEQTRLVHAADSAIEAMVLNGWIVEPTSKANEGLIRGLVIYEQTEMFSNES